MLLTGDTLVNCIQLSSLAAEQELYNLQKECEEKDAIIKELAATAHTSSTADDKVQYVVEDCQQYELYILMLSICLYAENSRAARNS